MNRDVHDRAVGAILGAFIGDALGLGPHWYYDLDALRRDYGPWIDGYTDPRPDRYHAGLKAGDLSQSGLVLKLTLQSLLARDGYDREDFCARLEQELFTRLDGTPQSGPGGYTSQSIRNAWRCRVVEGRDWTETGGPADTTEAIERTLAIAVRYAGRPKKLAEAVADNTALTQTDQTVLALTVAFCAVLGELVSGAPLDGNIGLRLMRKVKAGALPFHTVTTDDLQPPPKGVAEPPRPGRFPSPDALLSPGYMARAARDPDIRIEPAWKVSLIYGMPCAIYHVVPAAYYLAARFAEDFEAAVLHAVNGGGQNMARAMLTGALVGAQVGRSDIPERFVTGLNGHEELVALAEQLADAVVREADQGKDG